MRIFFREEAFYLDQRCILRDINGKHYIWQVENDRARKVEVEIVAANDDYSLVKGANPGLPVVIGGKSLLKDEVKLRVLNAEDK